jgi:hypothetical protein
VICSKCDRQANKCCTVEYSGSLPTQSAGVGHALGGRYLFPPEDTFASSTRHTWPESNIPVAPALEALLMQPASGLRREKLCTLRCTTLQYWGWRNSSGAVALRRRRRGMQGHATGGALSRLDPLALFTTAATYAQATHAAARLCVWGMRANLTLLIAVAAGAWECRYRWYLPCKHAADSSSGGIGQNDMPIMMVGEFSRLERGAPDSCRKGLPRPACNQLRREAQ